MQDTPAPLSRQERRALERTTTSVSGSPRSRWWLWLGAFVCVALVAWGIVSLARHAARPVLTAVPAVRVSDWSRSGAGPALGTTTATLIEYSDFQCPACANYEPWLTTLQAEFGSRLVFVYRHFPLFIHPNAVPAARAAEAAGLQKKFWEMHDLLFARQSEWSAAVPPTDLFVRYASDLRLDVEQFSKDYQSTAVRAVVDAATAESAALGLNHTPTFFLNGVELTGPSVTTLEGFRNAIRAALE